MESLYCAQRLDLIDNIISLLHMVSSSNPAQTPSTEEGSVLVKYGAYLRERYKAQHAIFSIQWPPAPTERALNLAMIKKTKVQRGEIPDEYVRKTITGKVDDIRRIKEPVKLEDIFQCDCEDRKVILIEGAPGSGKSTLSWNICQRWGAGELFQEYEVVILVLLRDPEVQAATTIADFLPAKDDAMAQSTAEQIAACEGEKILFVLDGWDELPHNLRDKSIFRRLIKPQLNRRVHSARMQ